MTDLPSTQRAMANPWIRLSSFSLIASLPMIDIWGTWAAIVFVASLCALAGLLFLENIPVRIDPLVMSLAGIGLVSALWSTEPQLSVRFSIILSLTFYAPMLVSAAMPTETFLRVLAYSLAATLPLHLLFGGIGNFDWFGLMASKNFFAIRMVQTAFTAAYMLLDTRNSSKVRLVFAVILAVSIYATIRANSAGAMLVSMAASCVLLYGVTIGNRPPHLRAIVILAASFVVLIGGALVLAYWSEITDSVLRAFSKDAGLTGRDYLWARARQYIAERPLLGIGAGAFWVQGNVEPEGLWRLSGVASRTGYNFHNLYFNMAVETGLISVALLIMFIGATIVSLGRWMLRGSLESAFFGAIFTIFILRTYVEVDFPLGFNVMTFLVATTRIISVQENASFRETLAPAARSLLRRGKMIRNDVESTSGGR